MPRSKYEKKAQLELESEGWTVDYKPLSRSWKAPTDFWNLFDLVAIKKGKPMRWISIKGKQGIPPAHRKKVKEFWMPVDNVKEIWKRSTSKSNYWYKQIIK